jgi:ribosomal protein S17
MALALILVLVSPALAQTASPSASPTGEVEDTAIEKLKEKVANKVTEIRRKNNKALAGTVLSKAGASFKIKTNDDQEYEIKLDDALTKYFRILGTKKQEIKQDDIEVDDYIIVTGVSSDKTITANTVFVDERFLVISGKISQVDKENYTLSIVTTAKEEIDLDIENTTRQSMINIKTHEPEASGFTKIKEGDTIHFVVSRPLNSKEKNYSAKKVLIIPQEYFLK